MMVVNFILSNVVYVYYFENCFEVILGKVFEC